MDVTVLKSSVEVSSSSSFKADENEDDEEDEELEFLRVDEDADSSVPPTMLANSILASCILPKTFQSSASMLS